LEINHSAEPDDNKSRLPIGVGLDTGVHMQVREWGRKPQTLLYEGDEGGENKRG